MSSAGKNQGKFRAFPGKRSLIHRYIIPMHIKSCVKKVLVLFLVVAGFCLGGKKLMKPGKDSKSILESRKAVYMSAGNQSKAFSAEAEKKYENMVLIPAGEFRMGSPRGEGDSDEYPAHNVYLDAFYIGKYEVAVDEYGKCVQAEECANPNTGTHCNWGKSDLGDHPINCVDWYQAKAYCKWKGTRLPTEAQWEKAACGGSDGKYCFRDARSQLGEYAWYNKNSGSRTHSVGQKKPNKYGIYDMHGNVWEWVSDWYNGSYYKNSPSKSPKGPSIGSYRVVRGGSWDNFADCCRFAYRGRSGPGVRGGVRGFRCAADRPPKYVLKIVQNHGTL